MKAGVELWINICDLYQEESAPWEQIAIVVAVPFSVTENGSKYTLQYYFNKLISTMPKQECQTIAQNVVHN